MLKIIKKFCIFSVLLASNCFGMDMLFKAIYSTLNSSPASATSSMANDVASDRFNTWTINAHTGMHTNNNEYMNSAANAISVKAIQKEFLAYTVDIQKAEIASIIQSHMKEFASNSLVQLNQKITAIGNHLAIMNYQKNDILNKSSIPSMHISQVDAKTCSDAVAKITSSNPTAQQQLDAQQKVYHDALTLKKIDVQIAAYEKLLENYQQQQAHFEAKLLQEFKPTIENAETKALISTEVPKLQQEIATLESALVKYQHEFKLQLECYKENQGKIIELESTWKHRLHFKKSEAAILATNEKNIDAQIKKINHEISLRESALFNAKIKFGYLEKFVDLRLNVQRCQDLAETQTIFSGFWKGGQFSIEDQKLLKAINTATFDQCDAKYQVTTMLDNHSQKWLVRFGIDLQKFEKRVGVDALQTHLLNEVNAKLNEVSSIYVKGATDAQVKKHMDAMVTAYTHTVDVIRTGTPQEAVASFKASGVLQKVAQAALTVKPDAQVDMILSSTAELAQASLDASKLGHIERSITITEVAHGIVDCVKTFQRLTDSEHSLALIQGAKNGIELGAKNAAEVSVQLVLHPIESLENICKALVKTASILGEIDQLNSQNLNKTQAEAIVANANKLSYALNETIKEINGMPSVQIAEKIGEIVGQIATETLIINRAFKAIEVSGTFAAKQTGTLLGKLGTAEHVVSAQKALITTEKGLSTAINTKGAEIAREIQVATEASSCIKSAGKVDLQEYYTSLMQDKAHGNKISIQSMEEAIAGITAEQQGFLAGPLKRDPTPAAEFIDKYGQRWDVKRAISRALNGKYIFNPKELLSAIKKDLILGENIILDMTKLEIIDLSKLHTEVIKNLTPSEIKRIIAVMKEETLKFTKR